MRACPCLMINRADGLGDNERYPMKKHSELVKDVMQAADLGGVL